MLNSEDQHVFLTLKKMAKREIVFHRSNIFHRKNFHRNNKIERKNFRIRSILNKKFSFDSNFLKSNHNEFVDPKLKNSLKNEEKRAPRRFIFLFIYFFFVQS
uniref:GTP binding protein n=1 Tax=Philodina roseola TaxID=96448 RepID=B2ZF95_PHIRO|nr:GTP binding protein [Philodina roseola]